jgi:hypothetical protein
MNPQKPIAADADTVILVRLSGHGGHDRTRCQLASVANDPGCVKTYTLDKCRKYNSPAWHPDMLLQHHQFS